MCAATVWLLMSNLVPLQKHTWGRHFLLTADVKFIHSELWRWKKSTSSRNHVEIFFDFLINSQKPLCLNIIQLDSTKWPHSLISLIYPCSNMCSLWLCLIIFISFVYVSQLPTLLEALYGNSSSSSDLLTFAFFFLWSSSIYPPSSCQHHLNDPSLCLPAALFFIE